MTRIFFAILKEIQRKDGTSDTIPAKITSGDFLLYDEVQFLAAIVQMTSAILLSSKVKRFGTPKFTAEECVAALQQAFDQKVRELKEQTIFVP